MQTAEEHCRHHTGTPNLNETKGLIEIKMDFSLTKLPCHESKITAIERGERQMLWVGQHMHEKIVDIISHRTAEEAAEEVVKEPARRGSSNKRKSLGLVKVRPL